MASGVTVGIRYQGREFVLAYFCSPLTSYKSSITPTTQSILNDTSLAATYDANGNRYLFFQDSTGHIRGAVGTNNEWSTSLNLGIDSNAKNYTPLAITDPVSADNFYVLLVSLNKA